MPSTFLDITGLSHFLDKLKLLIVQSDWAKTNSSDMAFIQNKPTVSVSGQTLVLTGWGNSAGTSYTVTFMLNDGTQTVYDTQTVVSGNTASAPTAPTRTDYSFSGWYEDSAGTTAFNFNTPITADKTLYAKWVVQSSGSSGTITLGSYGNTSDVYNCIIGFISVASRKNYAACGSINPITYDGSPIFEMGLEYGSIEFATEANPINMGTLAIGTQTFQVRSGGITNEQFQYLVNNIGNTLTWSFTPNE